MRRAAIVLTATLFASCTEEAPPDAPVAAPAPQTAAAVPAPPAPVLPERRLLVIEGNVTVDGKPGDTTQAVGETAEIIVDKDSRAVLAVQKGSAIELRAQSHVKLGSSTRKKTSLQLLAGIAWSILPTGKADFEVVTANAVAGVRGTTFYVDTATMPGQTILCACQGDVDLQAGKAKPKAVHSEHEHQAFLVKGKGKAAKLKAMGKAVDVPNHPNAQREQLRALADK